MNAPNIAILIVGSLHVLIAAAEIFLWKKPSVYTRLDKLHLTQSEADKVAPIVANAGIYNSFIAAGLICSVFIGGGAPCWKYFFLACVAIAGIFGAATLNRKPLILQTLPATIAAVLLWSSSAT